MFCQDLTQVNKRSRWGQSALHSPLPLPSDHERKLEGSQCKRNNDMGITAKSIYINDTNIWRENESVTISSIEE